LHILTSDSIRKQTANLQYILLISVKRNSRQGHQTKFVNENNKKSKKAKVSPERERIIKALTALAVEV